MSLPQIPYKMAKNKSQMIAMRSINYTDMLQDGDIVDSRNISARAYPYITTRKARERGDDYKNVEAITVFNGKIAHIAGGKFYYDGKEIGAISNGMKKMEKINSKLVIFPDKVYFDAQDGKLHDLGASVSSDSITFTKDSITVKNKAHLEAQGYGWQINDKTFSVSADTDIVVPEADVFRVAMGSGTYSSQRRFDGPVVRFGKRDGKTCIDFMYTCLAIANGNRLFIDLPDWNPTNDTSEIVDGRVYVRYQVNAGGVLVERETSGTLYEGGIYDAGYSYYTDANGKGIKRRYIRLKYGLSIEYDSVVEVYWKMPPPKIGKGSEFSLKRADSAFIDSLCMLKDGVHGNHSLPKYSTFIKNSYECPELDRIKVTSVTSDGYYIIDKTVDFEGICLGLFTLYGWDVDFTQKFTVGQNLVMNLDGVKVNFKVASLSERKIVGSESLGSKVGYALSSIFSLENNGELYDFNENFKVGDAVFVSGSSEVGNNTSFVISQIEQNTVFAETEIFTEVSNSSFVTIERRIPDFDFICESNNRIWGCSNDDNTVYASALGDPTNFFDYSGESTDSYAVAVGSEGEFTACCRYGDSVMFWKETKLHKVLGSYPAEYALYSYDIEGVQAGSEGSLVVMNEVLYFKGRDGVYAFSGGTPQLMSANFGDKKFNQARAGIDGNSYYISMRGEDGKNYLFVYETLSNIWVLEDDLRVRYFLRRAGDGLYMLTEGGEVYRCESGDTEADTEWYIQFAPLYETIEGLKSYSRFVFRLELAQEGYVIVEVKTDGGIWREAGKVVGRREGIFPVSLPINRCDKFEIRLRGKGKCKIHSIKREFHVGGDK